MFCLRTSETLALNHLFLFLYLFLYLLIHLFVFLYLFLYLLIGLPHPLVVLRLLLVPFDAAAAHRLGEDTYILDFSNGE